MNKKTDLAILPKNGLDKLIFPSYLCDASGSERGNRRTKDASGVSEKGEYHEPKMKLKTGMEVKLFSETVARRIVCRIATNDPNV